MKKLIFLALASAVLTFGLSAQAGQTASVKHHNHKVGQMAKHHKKHHKKHHLAA